MQGRWGASGVTANVLFMDRSGWWSQECALYNNSFSCTFVVCAFQDRSFWGLFCERAPAALSSSASPAHLFPSFSHATPPAHAPWESRGGVAEREALDVVGSFQDLAPAAGEGSSSTWPRKVTS